MKVFRRLVPALTALVVMAAACAPPEEAEVPTVPRPRLSATERTGELVLPSKGLAPLTGGTLTLMTDDVAAVSDPDHSLVVFVDLAKHRVRGSVKLPPGSQPTRATEDGAGNLQVILRGTGEVATLSPKTLSVGAVERVCTEPRGITWDARQRRTLIACATGELVSRPLEGPVAVMRPGGELRDVMVRRNDVVVSTFRASRLSTVGANGVVRAFGVPPRVPFGVFENAPVAFVPGTAWKTLALAGGAVAMVHQRSVDGDVRSTTELAGPEYVLETTTTYVPRVVGRAYYGGDIIVMDPVNHTIERPVCTTGVVRSAVTVFSPEGAVVGSREVLGILPIDAAASPGGLELAIVSAGNHQVTRVDLRDVTSVEGRACGLVQRPAPSPADDPIGQPTGIAYLPDGALLVHSRQPARLLVLEPDNRVREAFWLPEDGPSDTPGHRLFHTAPKAVACASCHPEGGDDGHVWTFSGEVRRTQPLTGGIARTAPYHWAGDRADMAAIMTDTFVDRMGGTPQDARVIADLTAFLDALPARASSPVSVDRLALGKTAFTNAGCASCHSGPLLTNNATVDVGTGAAFQVPSLVGLGARAPYMHDGCATTMGERFSKPGCGGTKHGDVARLSATELEALVDYLTTL
jgi:hypothetical protein